jgi:hypothetical protein
VPKPTAHHTCTALAARSGKHPMGRLRIFGVLLVVLAALAVHAVGGPEYILKVEAAQGAGLQDLMHRMFRKYHPLRHVWDRQRLVEDPIEHPHYPPPRTGNRTRNSSTYLQQSVAKNGHSSAMVSVATASKGFALASLPATVTGGP